MTAEERSVYNRRYKQDRKEEMRAYYRAWWSRNGELINARKRRRYRDDPEFRSNELNQKRRQKAKTAKNSDE